MAKDPSSGQAAGPRQPKARRKGVTIDLEAEGVGKGGTKKDPVASAAKKMAHSVSSEPTSPKATRHRAAKGKPAGKAKAAASARGQLDRKVGNLKSEPDRPAQSAVPPKAGKSQQPPGVAGQSSSSPPSSPSLAASRLVAAFAGGIIALGGAVVLDRLQIVSIFSAGPGLLDLQTEITGLQETTGGQIADLQARIAAIPATSGADGGAALGEKIAQIEASLLDRRETLDDLEMRLTALETAVQSGAADRGAGLAAIEQKFADMEETIAGVQDRGGAAAGDAVAAIKPEIDKLAGRVKTLESGASGLVDPQAVAALGARLEQLAGVIDQNASLQTIAALKSALAAESLAAAVAAGRPFAAELQILQSGPDGGADLTVLAPYAENGLPDAAALAAEFETLIPALLPLAAERPAAPQSTGLLGRLLASARNVVEVRQAGPGTGGEVMRQTGVIVQALNGNNLKAARMAWLDLPPQSRQASAGWAAKLEARLAADALAGSLRSEALSRLAAAGASQ